MDAATTELLKSGFIGATLVLVLVTGIAQKWVFGWVFVEMQKDRDYWRSQAMKTTDVSRQGANVAETVASLAERNSVTLAERAASDLAERTAAIILARSDKQRRGR